MAIDVRLLYKIKGKAGPELERVKKAVEWLLSPEAEGIGETLLRDAHNLHGKPITIEAVEGLTAYHPPHLGHKITIDSKAIGNTTLKDASGRDCTISVESSLGHELTHAGQSGVSEVLDNEITQIQIETSLKATERLTKAQQEAQMTYINEMMNAKDYKSAMQFLNKYVDEVALPVQEASLPILAQNPRFMEYVETFEQPAIDVENSISLLRDEPIRNDYLSSYNQSREAIHSAAKGEFTKMFKWDKLPDAPVSQEAKTWADSLTNNSDRQIT